MTGLLFFIVIAMWASVLIPIGLKNHDRKSLEKSLLQDGQQINRWHWQARESLNPRQRAFLRRRRAAMFLLSLLVGTIVMSAAGKISFAWVVLPIVLLVGFTKAAAKIPTPVRSVKPRGSFAQAQPTQVIPVSKVVVERIVEEKVEIQKRSWIPVETPLPSYVAAERAAAQARKVEVERNWTNQEMIDAAVELRNQRVAKLKEAQARLEQARALALENARRAALAADKNNGVPVTPFRRAVNQ